VSRRLGRSYKTKGLIYVDDLLAAGTVSLLSDRAGSKPLIADTDVSNAPMAAGFRRAGGSEFAGRREYGVNLTSGRT
jgi:hypothetical protein